MSYGWKTTLALIFFGCIVLFSLATFVLSLNSAWQSLKNERTEHLQTLLREEPVQTVLADYRFYAEKPYYVFLALDENSEERYFWVDGDTVLSERTSDLWTEQQVWEKIRSSHPGAQMIRITPGLVQGVPAWEVLLRQTGGKSTRYTYVYLQMEDGAEVKKLRLQVLR